MQNETLKLVYPQWQGGDIAAFFKVLKPSEAARGYVLGAQILNLLVSNLNANLDKNTAFVPISVDYENAINLISQNTQVVGLSVAEHLPKVQIKLKELLSNLPLIKE